MNELIYIWIGIIFYAVADGLLLAYLVKPGKVIKQFAFSLLAIAIVAHGYALFMAIDIGNLQNLSLSNIFSMIIWEAMIILWFAAIRMPINNLFLILTPFAIISLLCVKFFPGNTLLETQFDHQLFLHIMFSVMTFSIFALAFIQAIALLVQHKLLIGNKALTAGQFFPPLEMMERLLFLLIYIGFIMLTGILLSTVAFVNFSTLLSAVKHKIVLSLIAWIIFAALIIFRKKAGWHGIKSAVWTIAGYFILLLSYFGTELFIH